MLGHSRELRDLHWVHRRVCALCLAQSTANEADTAVGTREAGISLTRAHTNAAHRNCKRTVS